jgi:hypothetical protein
VSVVSIGGLVVAHVGRRLLLVVWVIHCFLFLIEPCVKSAHVAMKEGLFVCVMVFIQWSLSALEEGGAVKSPREAIPVVNFEWCKKVCKFQIVPDRTLSRTGSTRFHKKKYRSPTKFCSLLGHRHSLRRSEKQKTKSHRNWPC